MNILSSIGKRLATYLSQPVERDTQVATCHPSDLAATLKKGDILLIEGNTRISSAIKYLTQSTWSHAALYIGDDPYPHQTNKNEPVAMMEADINEGVRTIPLSMYSQFHTRICRLVSLLDKDINAVVDYVIAQIGDTYDVKNILDLARYLISSPPVPRDFDASPYFEIVKPTLSRGFNPYQVKLSS